MTPPALLRARARRQVLSCARCPLHAQCSAPVPMSGPVRPDYVVIGEAPGREEDRAGEPFVGPAGKLLRRCMGEVGLDPRKGAFLNAVSCWPRAGEGERAGNRAPTVAEQQACRPNLEAQMAAVAGDGEWAGAALLVGGVALGAFRDDLRVTAAQGTGFRWAVGRDRDRGVDWTGGQAWFVVPTIHPAAVLRAHGKRSLRRGLVDALEQFRGVVRHGIPPEWTKGRRCVVCGSLDLEAYDEDWAGFCALHWGKGQVKWRKARWKWRDAAIGGREVDGQLRMEV